MYENIHALNIRVNKFSMMPHENILTWKFVKLITVHVSPIKQLLATYASLFSYRNSSMQSNPKYVIAHARKPFPIDNALHDGC